MKKETGKYLAILLGIICLILAIILIYVKVMAADNKASEKDLNNKIEEELKYLDSNLISLMNKLNNITVINYKVYTREINDSSSNSAESSGKGNSSSSMQEGNSSSGESSGQSQQGGGSSGQGSSGGQGGSQSQNGSNSSTGSSKPITVSELIPNTILSNNSETDWTELAYLLENIYSTWPTISLDLKEKGIAVDMIDSFSLSMNGAIQSLKNQDKNNTLINLYNMYINLPKYIISITNDAGKVNLYNTKANILNAYVLATTSDKWNDITNSIIEAKNNFNTILTSRKEHNVWKIKE